jgi:hypothetical protein
MLNELENLDREFRSVWEERFGHDSRDETLGIYSESEQIERYANQLQFWREQKRSEDPRREIFVSQAEYNIFHKMRQNFSAELCRRILYRSFELPDIRKTCE